MTLTQVLSEKQERVSYLEGREINLENDVYHEECRVNYYYNETVRLKKIIDKILEKQKEN